MLDNGSGYIKAGLAGSNFPAVVVPNAFGRPVLRSGAGGNNSGVVLKEIMVGDETAGLGHLLAMQYPVRNGVIQDIDNMCTVWDYVFATKMNIDRDASGKGVDMSGRSLMLSEPPGLASKYRTQQYETFFERYSLDRVQSGVQGVLSLYSVGLTTGVAIDCGEGVTHCTPIFEGYSLPKANRRVDLGGRNITDFLVRLLQRRGYSLSRTNDFEVVRAIKEKFCYAAVDFGLEKRLAYETTTLEKAMLLPDGSSLTIGPERFEATEALFKPHLLDMESDGLSGQLWASIQACDIDLRAKLYEHVLLCGGGTMFPGLPTRVEQDMRALFLEHALKGDKSRMHRFKLKIEDPPRRKHMAYLGAAVMAQLSEDVTENWITKAEWDESGPSIIAQRFGTM